MLQPLQSAISIWLLMGSIAQAQRTTTLLLINNPVTSYTTGLTTPIVITIIVCTMLVLISLGVMIYYFCILNRRDSDKTGATGNKLGRGQTNIVNTGVSSQAPAQQDAFVEPMSGFMQPTTPFGNQSMLPAGPMSQGPTVDNLAMANEITGQPQSFNQPTLPMEYQTATSQYNVGGQGMSVLPSVLGSSNNLGTGLKTASGSQHRLDVQTGSSTPPPMPNQKTPVLTQKSGSESNGLSNIASVPGTKTKANKATLLGEAQLVVSASSEPQSQPPTAGAAAEPVKKPKQKIPTLQEAFVEMPPAEPDSNENLARPDPIDEVSNERSIPPVDEVTALRTDANATTHMNNFQGDSTKIEHQPSLKEVMKPALEHMDGFTLVEKELESMMNGIPDSLSTVPPPISEEPEQESTRERKKQLAEILEDVLPSESRGAQISYQQQPQSKTAPAQQFQQSYQPSYAAQPTPVIRPPVQNKAPDLQMAAILDDVLPSGHPAALVAQASNTATEPAGSLDVIDYYNNGQTQEIPQPGDTLGDQANEPTVIDSEPVRPPPSSPQSTQPLNNPPQQQQQQSYQMEHHGPDAGATLIEDAFLVPSKPPQMRPQVHPHQQFQRPPGWQNPPPNFRPYEIPGVMPARPFSVSSASNSNFNTVHRQRPPGPGAIPNTGQPQQQPMMAPGPQAGYMESTRPMFRPGGPVQPSQGYQQQSYGNQAGYPQQQNGYVSTQQQVPQQYYQQPRPASGGPQYYQGQGQR